MDENHLEKSDDQGTHSSDEQQAQVVLNADSAPATPSVLAQSQLCSSCASRGSPSSAWFATKMQIRRPDWLKPEKDRL